jgi:iron complex outermembrane receptor protein
MSTNHKTPSRGHLAAAIILGLALPAAVYATDARGGGSSLPAAAELDALGAPQEATPPSAKTLDAVRVTGTNIKRTDVEAAMPVTIIQKADIEAQGITSAEQLLMQLNIATNGSDSLAANNSVSPPGQADGRGNNGLSGANLRGQGADATLVLLNGRRVAAQGLAGQVVDLNSIPFQAIQRVEVLRDGASAVYGTDAIGGVVNFITKTDYQGLSVTAGADVTQEGGGNIYNASALAGWGDLDTDRWNVWINVSAKKNQILRGTQRDFTNQYQYDRGLGPDSRGGPLGNVVADSATQQAASGGVKSLISLGLTDPNGGGNMTTIGTPRLPGGIGCENAGDLMGDYDYAIWGAGAKYACAWDYGAARTLQQQVDTQQFIGRATFKIGDNSQFYVEAMASEVKSHRRFEALQLTTNILNTAPVTAAGQLDPYPLNANSQATYDSIYKALLDYFGPQANLVYGNPISYRYRCYECGPREYTTTNKSYRILFGLDGSIGSWDYTSGLSRSSSRAQSVLSNGFVYTAPLKALLASGKFNPFLPPGQSQSQEVLDAFAAMSADGTELYHGQTTTTTFDATFSGSLGFHLWGKDEVQAAVGTEMRREEYSFGGPDLWNTVANPLTGGNAWIYQAAGDAANYMTGKARTVKAAYAEFLVPVVDSLDVTVSGRFDHYSGFGGTFNPKYSFKWQPVDWLAFRGSYSTGFKVPDFARLFRGVTEAPSTGTGDYADPATCPGGRPETNTPGCEAIFPNVLTGGNPNLKPETSKQSSIGFVLAPTNNFNMSVDWWQIERENTIRSITLAELRTNYDIFKDNWIRDSSGNIVQVDQRFVNTGGTLTTGIELDANLRGELAGGHWRINLNGNYLQQYKTKTLETSPWSDNRVGKFTQWGILPLKWKYTLSAGWNKGDWAHTLTQVYRDGYLDAPASGFDPGAIRTGAVVRPDYNPNVSSYTTYNYSLTWTGMEKLKATFTIRNLLNTDPPFTLSYLDYGGGSAWEPRVADPRGRSFNLLLQYDFK